MAVMKDWIQDIVDELECEPIEGWSSEKKKWIIEKHCPFKMGVAYEEVTETSRKLDEILASVKTLRRAL